MKPKLKWTLMLSILFVSVVLDQITKVIAVDKLKGVPPIHLIDGFARLQYAENSGAMLSFGANLPNIARILIFQVGVAVMLLAIFIYTMTRKGWSPWALAAVALIVGGGIGNLIDRVLNDSRVVDFMVLGSHDLGYQTGVFNVADIWIMVGAIFLAICGFIPGMIPSGDENKSPEPTPEDA